MPAQKHTHIQDNIHHMGFFLTSGKNVYQFVCINIYIFYILFFSVHATRHTNYGIIFFKAKYTQLIRDALFFSPRSQTI